MIADGAKRRKQPIDPVRFLTGHYGYSCEYDVKNKGSQKGHPLLTTRLTIAFLGFALLPGGTAQAQSSNIARTYAEKGELSATVAERGYRQTWELAKAQCAELDFKGGGGWRLPDRDEVRRINVYDNRELLPQEIKDSGVCDVRMWTSETEPEPKGRGENGLWFCRASNKEYLENYTGASDDALTMCVRTGRPTSPVAVEPKKPVARKTWSETEAAKASAPTIALTRTPDRTEEDNAAAGRGPREHEKARAAAEQRVAKEAAEELARKLAANLKGRERCLKPESRGMCGCLMYQATPPGGWKTCGK